MIEFGTDIQAEYYQHQRKCEHLGGKYGLRNYRCSSWQNRLKAADPRRSYRASLLRRLRMRIRRISRHSTPFLAQYASLQNIIRPYSRIGSSTQLHITPRLLFCALFHPDSASDCAIYSCLAPSPAHCGRPPATGTCGFEVDHARAAHLLPSLGPFHQAAQRNLSRPCLTPHYRGSR